MKVAEGAGWGKCDFLKTLQIDMYGPIVQIKTFVIVLNGPIFTHKKVADQKEHCISSSYHHHLPCPLLRWLGFWVGLASTVVPWGS